MKKRKPQTVRVTFTIDPAALDHFSANYREVSSSPTEYPALAAAEAVVAMLKGVWNGNADAAKIGWRVKPPE